MRRAGGVCLIPLPGDGNRPIRRSAPRRRTASAGQVAAREVLLNTPAVSQLVLEGKTSQLPVALDSGRRHGMVPLTDSLAAHVREGTVNVAEAYRKAIDRAALLAQLKKEGVDTSFAERLA